MEDITYYYGLFKKDLSKKINETHYEFITDFIDDLISNHKIEIKHEYQIGYDDGYYA